MREVIRLLGWRLRLLLLLFITLPCCHAQQQEQQQHDIIISPGKLRSSADEAMMQGDYRHATELLRQALQHEPHNALNAFKLYKVKLRSKHYMDALDSISLATLLQEEDTTATTTTTTSPPYRSLKAKLLLQLGQCDRAVVELELLMERERKSSSSGSKNNHHEEDLIKAKECQKILEAAHTAFAELEFHDAALWYEQALTFVDFATGSALDLLWPRAQSLFAVQDLYGTISETAKILKQHPHHVEAYQLRGEAYHRLGEHEQAIIHYREGLKLDPEHVGCKQGHKVVKLLEKRKSKGQEAYDQADFATAVEQWTAALNVDPSHRAFNRPLLLQLALAYSKLEQLDKALEIAKSHVQDEETVEGLWGLAEVQTAAEQFDEALRTYQRASEIATDNVKQDADQKVRQAQVAVKQSKEKNYYKILGVQRTATGKEIKKAYREKALRWHPDKVSEDEKEKAQSMFQDIGEAYEVLSDDELRAKYDRGEQVFDNQGGGGGGHHTDPFQFFNTQFHHSGGGGGQRIHFRFN